MRRRLTRLLQILSLFLVYTAYKSAQLWPAEPVAAVAIGFVFFALMMGGSFVSRSNPDAYSTLWFRLLAWVGSLAMGLWFTFVLISLPFDLLRLVVFLLARVFGVTLFTPETADLVLPTFYVGVALFALVLTGLGFWQAARGARVRAIDLPVEGLPAELDGLKIAQISDLHVGPTIRTKYVRSVVERTNAEAPELVLFTGDIADSHARSVAPHLEPLRELRAPLGKFYCTGNHEYYWGADDLIASFRQVGLNPLVNANAVVAVGSAKVLVAGVTDPMGSAFPGQHAPDLPRAARTNEKVDYRILLAHRPDVSIGAEPLGFDLQLSGHTHAGQFFPFSLFIGFAHQYTRGRYRHGRMWVYVNPGTGYWGPANRLGVAPEITLLTLRRV